MARETYLGGAFGRPTQPEGSAQTKYPKSRISYEVQKAISQGSERRAEIKGSQNPIPPTVK